MISAKIYVSVVAVAKKYQKRNLGWTANSEGTIGLTKKGVEKFDKWGYRYTYCFTGFVR